MKTEKTESPELEPKPKQSIPDVRPGDTVRVYQRVSPSASPKKGKKERKGKKLQSFEGIIIARKHGKEPGATITVRKEVSGVGVERIFPLHSPLIEKIEILKRGKVRRAKLYYLRKVRGKKAKIKERK